ncbi:PHP domain-containing protein [Silvibacterium sp.]|uniref:PHP domain-containing protein n=1 Tax=Silvibacterium sp. TaxID=1964179 RepID=UPI0039E37204
MHSLIDLHSHTDFSDGTLSPRALVRHAAERGVSLLAITDHDTVDAFSEALPADQALSPGETLTLLCGVELSTHAEPSERSVHLLAYFPDLPPQGFREWLLALQEGRRARNVELLEKLRSLGLDLTWEEVQSLAQRQIGRPHFAQALLRRGYVSSLREAFDRYLGEGSAAWVERDEPSLAEALARVKEAGGLSSLAHPVRITRNTHELETFIADHAALGLDAVECFHPEVSPELSEQLIRIVAQLGLGMTGGSDFHGANKPGIALGTGKDDALRVPEAVGTWIVQQLSGRRTNQEARCSSAHSTKQE